MAKLNIEGIRGAKFKKDDNGKVHYEIFTKSGIWDGVISDADIKIAQQMVKKALAEK